jgi:hypothetical protein
MQMVQKHVRACSHVLPFLLEVTFKDTYSTIKSLVLVDCTSGETLIKSIQTCFSPTHPCTTISVAPKHVV